jgi:hypothetical protein
VNGVFRPGLGSLFDTTYDLEYDPYKLRNVRYRTSTRYRFERRPPRSTREDDAGDGDRENPRASGDPGALDGPLEARQRINVVHDPVFPQAFTLSGSLTFSGAESSDKSLQTNFGTRFNLTRNWRVEYAMLYDLVDRIVVSQNYTVTRDLHCWEAQFRRSFSGGRWEYYFRITLKDLPEIFYERGTDNARGPRLY